MSDRPTGQSDSALAVWLKIAALLAGFTVFGLLIFWLSRMAHHVG